MIVAVSRALIPAALFGGAHLLLLSGLASTDTVHELLGSAKPNVELAIVLFGFYLLRLFTFFFVPGWTIARLGIAIYTVQKLKSGGAPPGRSAIARG